MNYSLMSLMQNCEEFFGLFVTFFSLAKMLGTFLNRLMVKEADSDKSHNP